MAAKIKLDTFETLISKLLHDSYIRQKESVLVNNVLKEYNEIKIESKKPKTSVENIK